jgi:hypothetical protein
VEDSPGPQPCQRHGCRRRAEDGGDRGNGVDHAELVVSRATDESRSRRVGYLGSPSTVRASNEYSTCSAISGAQPRSSAIVWACADTQAGALENPR